MLAHNSLRVFDLWATHNLREDSIAVGGPILFVHCDDTTTRQLGIRTKAKDVGLKIIMNYFILTPKDKCT